MPTPLADSYAWQCLSGAISGMAADPGSPRERLWGAWLGHLHKLRLEELPPPLHDDFRELRGLLTALPEGGGKGAAENTIASLGDKESAAIIGRISTLLWGLARELGDPATANSGTGDRG